MATYKTPGVYVQENLQPLFDSPIGNTTDAIPTFVGTNAQGGPIGPTLVTSWSQFTSLFGSIQTAGTDQLPFSVYSFFSNGGSQCYVVRAVAANATTASVSLLDDSTTLTGSTTALSSALSTGAPITSLAVTAVPYSIQTGTTVTVTSSTYTQTFTLSGPVSAGAQTLPVTSQTPNYAYPSGAVVTISSISASLPCLTVTSKAPGVWASNGGNTQVYVTVNKASTGVLASAPFDLIIEVGTGSGLIAREQFISVTLDPTSPRYALNVVNSPTIGSNYVSLSSSGTWSSDPTDVNHIGNPAAVTAVHLTGGSDGTGSPDYRATCSTYLDPLDYLLVINLPGVTSTSDLTPVIQWAQASSVGRFVVVDVPSPAANDTNTSTAISYVTYAQSLPATSYAAVYGPWVWVADPASSVSGALRLIAPGGAVLGQYVRNDASRGISHSPAGVGTALGVNQTWCNYTSTQLDSLNSASVNVIRSIPGAGFCIMGARSLNIGAPDLYVNIRRTLLYLRQSMVNITQFAVFENNDDTTRKTVTAIISQFLTAFWGTGGLAGDKASDAFYVICDSTNNTPQTVAAGVLNVQIGVALERPAEFIVITLGQYAGPGGSTATDSLTPSGL